MYAFEITINNSHVLKYDDFEHHIFAYLRFLQDNGQILPKDDHLSIIQGKTTKITVVCPEQDSLSTKYMNQYARQMHDKIVQGTGNLITHQLVGYDYDYPLPRFAPPNQSQFYVLRYGWSSPIIDGITHQGIPLYHLPMQDCDDRFIDELWSWYRQAQALYRLWLGSVPDTEAFALQHRQSVDSSHSQIGRKLCQQIETVTGVPTYYFLANYRDWSKAADLNQKCPLTGQDWRIDSKISNYIDFKCDKSRLVSEFSQNCADNDI
jgi:predicted  nucleic acid-binding Zn ribbon protein